MPARLYYQDFEFTAGGARPWLGQRRTYLDEGGGPARKMQVEFTVKVQFHEGDFSGNQARYLELREALAAAPEGVLRYDDENGQTVVNARVRVAADELPEQWGQHMLEVSVGFRAVELLGEAPETAMTYAAVAGSTVTLPGVARFTENIQANRYSTQVPNRRETVGVVSAGGVVRADPQLPYAQRVLFLTSKKAELDAAIDSKHGDLTFAGFSERVRVDSFACDLGDGSEELRWSLQASYLRFPAGVYAEAEFVVTTRDGYTASERIVSVRGKVRASDENGAAAKVASIEATYSQGRQIQTKETGVPRWDGVDGAAFVEMEFTLEFRQTIDVVSYQLQISTRRDARSALTTISYGGTVTATTATAALAQARTLGDAKHPVQMTATETIESTGVAGQELFVRVTFSYEYATQITGGTYAEVTMEADRATFGANTQTISGFAVAVTKGEAETMARGFKLGASAMLRQERESSDTVQRGTNGLFSRLSFSYTYHLDAVAGSITYARKVSEDLRTREVTTSYTGTAYGDTEAAANGLINALVQGETARRLQNERESHFDRTAAPSPGGITKFMHRTFSITFVGVMAAGADDILEAEFSMEIIPSVQKAILTEIPFGTPHVQTACGLTVGYQRASGRVTALTENSARAWARQRQPSGGHMTGGDDRERMSYRFLPMSGTTIQTRTCDFDYSRAYPNMAPVVVT